MFIFLDTGLIHPNHFFLLSRIFGYILIDVFFLLNQLFLNFNYWFE